MYIGGIIMNNIKDLLYKGIESERECAIKEYDRLSDLVDQEDKIPKLYELIVETYHNSLPQRDVAEKFLKEVLVDDFFKKAEVNRGVNEIIFHDDRYKIAFPLSRYRHINITDTKIKKPPYFLEKTNAWLIELIQLAEVYLSNKNLSNLKKLDESYNYNRRPKNFIGSIFNYYETYKTFDRAKLESLENKLASYNARAKENKELVKEYESEREKSILFAYSLKEFEMWQDCGWDINHYENGLRLSLDYKQNKSELSEPEN